ncbi:MAG: regulatory protein RecX [Candidatus Omnitrophota bacterium]
MRDPEEKEFEKGLRYCIRLLSLRARTEHELEVRLKERGYDEGVRHRILSRVKHDKLTDDLEFSKEWVEYRIRSARVSVNLLRAELKRKGIDERTVEEAFRDKADLLDDRKNAAGLIKEKLSGSGSGVSGDVKLKAKLYRLLVGKGYDPETAEEAVSGE